MEYKTLVELYENVEGTSKRIEKTYYVSKVLQKASEADLHMLCLLLQGRVFPAWDPRKIGLAIKMLIKALNIATGTTSEKIEELWKTEGDLGKVAEILISKKKQVTLFSKELSVKKVFTNLQKLSEIEGIGSVDKKIALVAELLTSATPIEAKYIARNTLEDLRVGIGDGTLRDAIVWAFFPPVIGINNYNDEVKELKFKKEIDPPPKGKLYENKNISEDIQEYDAIFLKTEKDARAAYVSLTDTVQRAYDIANDFGIVAQEAKTNGIKGLKSLKLTIGKPVKVMLFPKAQDIKDAFEIVGKPAAFEYKYDGFRLLIHKIGKKVILFTRKLEDVSKQFPDVADAIRKGISKDCILDAEVVGYDPRNKKYLPFQNISQRIRRKYDIAKLSKEVPVVVKVFDMIEVEDENLLDVAFQIRREKLERILTEEKLKLELAEQIITDKEEEAEKFYKEALNVGNEGVMAKNLKAPYKPGSRVGHAVKVKPVMETLDLVIVKAEWGTGKRSGWFTSFTIACISEDGEFVEIGKFGTGLKELEEEGVSFNHLTELLKPLVISEKGKESTVKPSIVIEINYEEIQKSNSYSSGYALRFPRFMRLREDRSPEEITDIHQVDELYARQRGRG